MSRWIRKLLGLYPYDPPMASCLVCKVLQEQLDYERSNNREMLETLTSLLKPQVITQSNEEFKPITPHHTRWSRRRAELERMEREKARVNATSVVVATPDNENDIKLSDTNNVTPMSEDVKRLEEELGVQ